MSESKDERTFVYRIDASNRIVYLNGAWDEFARENEAPELADDQILGKPLQQFVAGWETRHLYELVYASVRRHRREISLPFNCDSPTWRRAFRMRVLPLPADGLEFAVKVVQIAPLSPQPLLERHIERAPAILVICSWCKKLRLENDRWAAIEEVAAGGDLFTAAPPRLSHGVCPDCFAIVWRQLDDRPR
jgi:hypothetical protein